MFYKIKNRLYKLYRKISRFYWSGGFVEKGVDLSTLRHIKCERITYGETAAGSITASHCVDNLRTQLVAREAEREAYREQGLIKYGAKRVLFVLPAGAAGGGANVVVTEIMAMRRMGVDARLLNLQANRFGFERDYPVNDLPVVWVENPASITAQLCKEYDAVIATSYKTVAWLEKCAHGCAQTVLGYYVQDYEPFFEKEGTAQYEEALSSYTRIERMRRFTKTGWNRAVLLGRTGCNSRVVFPSFDCDTFYPSSRWERHNLTRKLRVVAMVKPDTPRRNPEGTVRILKKLSNKYGRKVEIIVFGIDGGDPLWLSLKPYLQWLNVGLLNPMQMQVLLNESDIFCDFSFYQAMGLTALEAMACGVAVIAPQKGGAKSFIRDGHNAILVDTAHEEQCFQALEQLLLDAELRSGIQQNALDSVWEFHPERSAWCILQTLFDH